MCHLKTLNISHILFSQLGAALWSVFPVESIPHLEGKVTVNSYQKQGKDERRENKKNSAPIGLLPEFKGTLFSLNPTFKTWLNCPFSDLGSVYKISPIFCYHLLFSFCKCALLQLYFISLWKQSYLFLRPGFSNALKCSGRLYPLPSHWVISTQLFTWNFLHTVTPDIKYFELYVVSIEF